MKPHPEIKLKGHLKNKAKQQIDILKTCFAFLTSYNITLYKLLIMQSVRDSNTQILCKKTKKDSNTYEWSRLTPRALKPFPRWGFKLTWRNIRSEVYATTLLKYKVQQNTNKCEKSDALFWFFGKFCSHSLACKSNYHIATRRQYINYQDMQVGNKCIWYNQMRFSAISISTNSPN